MDQESTDLPSKLNKLGVELMNRYSITGDLKDIEESITNYKKAILLTASNSKDLPIYLGTLGFALKSRFFHSWNKKDLNEAIRNYKKVILLTDQKSLDLPYLLNDLGVCLRYKYTRKGLNEAIENFEKAISLTDTKSPDLPYFINNLGQALRALYSLTGDANKLEKAIANFKEAISLTDSNTPDLPDYFKDLGNSLNDKYSITDDPKDKEEAIDNFKRAISLIKNSPTILFYDLENLNNSFMDLYSRTSNLKYLEEAIVYSKQVASLFNPNLSGSLSIPDYSNLPYYLNKLGNKLIKLYLRTNDLKYLDEAIDNFKRGISLIPPNSHNLPILNDLSISLKYRYSHIGDLKSLDEAIDNFRHILSKTDINSPDYLMILNNLGAILRDRYLHKGDMKDLEEAIASRKQVVSLADPKSPYLPIFLNNLGSCLFDSYYRTGNRKDLDEAIVYSKQSLSLDDSLSSHLPTHLNNLGARLIDRYSLTHDLNDLEEAVTSYKRAITLTDSNSPDYPHYLHNLGNCLRERYSRTSDMKDLEEAIRLCKQAISFSSSNCSSLPLYLSDLGNGLIERFYHTGDLKNLKEAIVSSRQAVSLTDSNSHYLPTFLNNLGNCLKDCYLQTHELKDLKEAFETYQKAKTSMDLSFSQVMVEYKLGQRKNLVDIDVNLFNSALMLRELSLPDERSQWAIKLMVIAEGSKSRVLNELIARSGILVPSSIPPNLADEEAQIVNQLRNIDSKVFSSQGLSSVAEEASDARISRFNERVELVKRLDELWSKMEVLNEEAAYFVNLRRGKSPSWEDLSSLAKEVGNDSAIISMFISSEKIFFFVLKGEWGHPEVIEVPALEYFAVDHRSLITMQFESICLHLNGINNVVLSPYGPGNSVHWQALAKYINFNTLWVSVPSLGSLQGILKRSYTIKGRPLIVGNPIGDLNYAEKEAKTLAERLNTTSYIGSRATKELVMEILPKARIVHFATHAYFDSKDPLDSGIVLANGVLTAREIMEIGARPELLVLSACETGKAESMGGNEIMGLSQAFLQAGTKSLLVSLWKVDDESTSFLMENFYNFWLEGDNKAEALSKAMNKTREIEKWKDISYWGAFSLVGDWR